MSKYVQRKMEEIKMGTHVLALPNLWKGKVVSVCVCKVYTSAHFSRKLVLTIDRENCEIEVMTCRCDTPPELSQFVAHFGAFTVNANEEYE